METSARQGVCQEGWLRSEGKARQSKSRTIELCSCAVSENNGSLLGVSFAPTPPRGLLHFLCVLHFE